MTDQTEKTYYLHYHLKPIRIKELCISTTHVSITAMIVQKGDAAVLHFGFSRLKDGDQFSRKYGRQLTTLRAEKDATLVVGFKKEFVTEYFLKVAKEFGKEVAFHTQLGDSLLSELKLPEEKTEKVRVKWTEEQIQAAREEHLNHVTSGVTTTKA